MGLRYHLQEALKMSPAQSPWPRMFICAGATALPLIVGLFLNQLPISIFGALIGFLLVLNDHLGTLGHRLWVITLTFVVMAASLSLGIFISGEKTVFVILLLGLIYWMALMSGEGAELERVLLFGIFLLLAGYYTPQLATHMELVVQYALLGYLAVIATLIVVVFLRRHTPSPFARLRTSLRMSLTKEPHRHLYAVIFGFTMLCSLLIIDFLNLNHGYWALGTVLIIIRPDTKASLYRGIQRFFGTLVGVLLAELIIYTVHWPWLAIVVIAAVAFVSPWALLRNYWWGSAMISIMLLMLLDLPSIDNGDFHTPLVRLQATALGCALALIGILLMHLRIQRKEAPRI